MTSISQKNLSNNSNSNNSNYVEIENQFMLRMPTIKSDNGTLKPHPATIALREALSQSQAKTQDDTNIDPLKDRLFIELNPDTRKGRVKFDNEIFDARLMDLPCIIESLKTIDKKIFYKTSDICQMLVCKTKDDPFSNSEDEKKEKEKNAKKSNQMDTFNSHLRKYQWPHGIAPPLKNVRRKRFRRVAKKKIIDYAEIEKEVKQLFRSDRESVKIDYEVVYVEADPDDDNDENKSCEKLDDYDSDDDDNMDKSNLNDNYKSKSIIEESNLSTEEINDDSMATRNTIKLKTNDQDDISNLNPSTNLNFDDMSNDTSQMDLDTKKKNRTNFRNIFVNEVIGDLSSSDEANDEDEQDAEDEEDEDDEFSKSKSNKPKPKSITSGLFGDGDDSISNFDDNKTATRNEYENEESYSNIESTKNKSKFNDTNEYGLGDDDEDEDDTDHDSSKKELEAGNLDSEDTSSNFNNKKPNDDGMSVASPLASTDDTKVELNTKLNKLMDELHRIQEERKRREIEINPINNPVLKAHLSSRLNNLIDEENKKQSEIDELREMI